MFKMPSEIVITEVGYMKTVKQFQFTFFEDSIKMTGLATVKHYFGIDKYNVSLKFKDSRNCRHNIELVVSGNNAKDSVKNAMKEYFI